MKTNETNRRESGDTVLKDTAIKRQNIYLATKVHRHCTLVLLANAR